MKDFRELKVWQKGYDLVLRISKVTLNFPEIEKFGLVSQMRRSAVSIIANIAEGNKRRTNKDFKHFLNIAEGSLEEIKYFLFLKN
ncbi:MAG: four helix bundle protein [Candidatus Omnitrophica bacterium]|nr:four helix bundle protein [Candidatus Omnitrophota bacterium]